MKAKHLWLAIAALLVAVGGLWLARSAWRTHAFPKSSMGVGLKTPGDRNVDPNSAASLSSAPQTGPNSGQMLNPPSPVTPPVPNRRFMDFTPEQRVQFARQGHGPGG